ncbi:hypothetical protein ACFL1H_06035 [Nanoarchaeota archaeon]
MTSYHIVKYDPKVYLGENPLLLQKEILEIHKDTEILAYDSNKNILLIEIPNEKIEEIKNLEGVIEVHQDLKKEL